MQSEQEPLPVWDRKRGIFVFQKAKKKRASQPEESPRVLKKPKGQTRRERKKIALQKPNYREHLKSARWRAIRLRIVKRARGKCERCKEPCRRFQVHHLTYKHLGDERWAELQALCSACHMEVHGILNPKAPCWTR